MASLQIGCSTLKTTLKSAELSSERLHSAVFRVVLRVEQSICKLASSEMALQPTNDAHININRIPAARSAQTCSVLHVGSKHFHQAEISVMILHRRDMFAA